MTVPLLFITLGGALLFASIRCVQLLPLLAGRRVPATHCTGSLLLLATGAITGLLTKLLGAAGLGALLGAGAKALGRGGKITPPEEEAPPPLELPPAALGSFIRPQPGVQLTSSSGQPLTAFV